MKNANYLRRIIQLTFAWTGIATVSSLNVTTYHCIASLHRREPCGYRGISETECEKRSHCCFQHTSIYGIPKCFKKIPVNTVEVCPTSIAEREQCGYKGIPKGLCTIRGCCYEKTIYGTPACHKPVILPILTANHAKPTPPPRPQNPKPKKSKNQDADGGLNDESVLSIVNMFRQMPGWQNATRSCNMDPDSRKQCGYSGITNRECQQKGCCWNDLTMTSGASGCFYPIWRISTRNSDTQQNGNGSTVMDLPVEVTDHSEGSKSQEFHESTRTPRDELPPYRDDEIAPPSDHIQEPTTETNANHQVPSPTPTSMSRQLNGNIINSPYLLTYLNLNYLKAVHNAKVPPTSTCSSKGNSCCDRNPHSPCCENYSASKRSLEPQFRIIGGSRAGFLKSSVAYLTTKYHPSQFCGGTLINRRWIVTAAHCILDYCNERKNNSEIIIKLGKVMKANMITGPNEQEFSVAKVICHPYNCKDGNHPRINDIGLIKLSRPAQRNAHVNVASLPYLDEQPKKGEKCFVLGWGETKGHVPSNALKQVPVSFHTNEECNKPDWRNCMVKNCMMCAGELNMDACEGDSGGPLFCLRREKYYVLHGVYSWGRCGAELKKPAIYTRFSYYVNWIKKEIYADRRK